MKYIVQLQIEVEAENDDAALFWIDDAIKLYGQEMSIHRWIDTTTKESSNGNNSNNQ
jgi:hypothetical protein